MSTDAISSPDDALYGLLPAFYQRRDAEQGYPLRALLRAIGGQLDALTADTARQYDNWFIETCDDDLVSYFAELVGLALGPALPTSADPATSSVDAIWRRREVADALADRRRKGSFSVLEQLAADATGWPSRAVELGRLALATQSVRWPDVGARPLLDMREMEALARLGTPLSVAAPLPDVRRLSSHRTPGTVNPSGVAVWLWRLVADGVDHAPAAPAPEEGGFTFDQLARDLPLPVRPVPRAAGSPAVSDLDVATPITRRALELRLEDYYGRGRSICVYRGREPVPRSEILVADLHGWRARIPVGRVGIDPELGRIAFPARHSPEEPILVTCARLGIGAIGGGQYLRRLAAPAAPVFRVGARAVGVHRTVGNAVKAWRAAKGANASASAVIEIVDDGAYEEPFEIKLDAGERLEIRAAQGRRPVLIPSASGRGRPSRFLVRGSEEAADPAAPEFVLDGVWIARHSLDLDGRFSAVTLRHCTLVPAGALSPETGEGRHASSLVVRAMPCPISITSSVVGRIRVDIPEAGFDPIPLRVSDSVLDASGLHDLAVLGGDERPAWVCLSLVRSTVLGGAHVHSIGLVENSIVMGGLECERRQSGHVRFSYLVPGSLTPRRTACQPDDALAALDAEVVAGLLAPTERNRRAALESTRLVPRFAAVHFGEPAYARLADDIAVELARGAHDEGELGAYHDLWQTLRVAELRARLRDFAPAGTDIDIRFAT